jgi:colanic acid/amylovoran biosynthesis glycosyltransferase
MDKQTQLLGNIVEVAPSWPAEVFIQRHIQALRNEPVVIQIVVRQSKLPISRQASVQEDVIQANIVWIPDFDRLTIPKKVVVILRYGLSAGSGRHGLNMRQRALLGFFAEMKSKLIHFHNAQLAVSMSWICQEIGIPYTVSLRGADVQEIPLRSTKLHEATRQALLGASGIHTVCEAFGRNTMLEGMQTTTIYTSIPVPDRLGKYQLEEKDGYHLLSIGRLHWRKGYPDLLVALRGLLDIGLNARLTIVGTGPDEDRVKYWIERLSLKEHVHLPGKLNFRQIQKLFQNAHAYVQSSCAEGLSNALVEAMAWGCPVFATDVAGTREMIRDGENGFLLEPLSPERWVDKLSLVTDSKRMRTVRTVAHEDARQRFAAEVHARQFVDFYRKAVERYSISSGVEDDVVDRGILQPKGKVEQNIEAPKVLVRLPWEWCYGVDQVLRALAPLVMRGKLQIKFCGAGSAEDELRYLVFFLGLVQKCVIRIEPNTLDLSEGSDEPGSLKLVIDCPDHSKPVWKVSDGQRENIIEIGETAELLQSVESFLEHEETRC